MQCVCVQLMFRKFQCHSEKRTFKRIHTKCSYFVCFFFVCCCSFSPFWLEVQRIFFSLFYFVRTVRYRQTWIYNYSQFEYDELVTAVGLTITLNDENKYWKEKHGHDLNGGRWPRISCLEIINSFSLSLELLFGKKNRISGRNIS